jgi:hypothetical protein
MSEIILHESEFFSDEPSGASQNGIFFQIRPAALCCAQDFMQRDILHSALKSMSKNKG